MPNDRRPFTEEIPGGIGLDYSGFKIWRTQTTYVSIYNQGLSKGVGNLYIINETVSPSLMNKIICLIIGKSEKKVIWLTFPLNKEKKRKELKEQKS